MRLVGFGVERGHGRNTLDGMEYTIHHKGQKYTMLIDDADAHLIADKSVYLHTMGYASWTKLKNNRQRGYVHHLIVGKMPKASGMVADHINGNRLDNRRCNLRVIPAAMSNFNQSLRKDNTSGIRGISLHTQSGKWHARITTFGRRRSLGYFDTPEEAGAAYRREAKRLLLPLRSEPLTKETT